MKGEHALIKRLPILLVVALALAACGLPPPTPSAVPPAAPTEVPGSSPSLSPPPDAATTPLPNGFTRVSPSSRPGAVGEVAPFRLWTHCGLENAVIDFGGTLWDVAGFPGRYPNPPQGFGNPDDQGTISRTGPGSARYVSASGVPLALTAHDGPKVVFVCY
jgi:hypothetical protein